MKTEKYDFTPKQREAVFTENKNLLVSAGAGSGKTTVLTQRLINKIKSGDSVTDFLVVTFMKAAAADIKSKLYDSLLEEIAIDPENDRLYRQSLLVSEADICTISSYCFSLVKENFALLGISPKVRAIDETESAMLLRRVADEIIKNGYESEDDAFLRFAENFSGDKNDTPLSDTMIQLYNTLRVTLDRSQTLISCAEKLKKEAEIIRNKGFFASDIGNAVKTRLKRLYTEFVKEAEDIYNFAVTVATEDKYLSPLERLLNGFERIYDSLDVDYVNYCDTVETAFEKTKLASSGCEKEDREIIGEMKDALMKAHKKVAESYIRGDDEYNAKSFEECADIVLYINKFIDELEKGYESIKQENGVLDFGDFERKALDLLEIKDENGNYVPTELCLKKRQEFKEILIDEYQDVNPMQDRIFNLLSGNCHRFMVGDVKQSIYRFRNAYPAIFLGYKEKYPNIDVDKDSDDACIFLRENFRCGEAVINYVNYLFDGVTLDTQFRNEYEGEWLIKATKRADKKTPVVIAVADKEKGEAIEARKKEADFIASEILRLKNTELSDEGHKFKYSDFAVMLSAMKGYSIEYEKAFNKYGIPYKTEVSESFLENPDVRLAVAALKAIDDPTDDISLCALMRSPICNFSSNELYEIRQRMKKTAFWNAVCKTAYPNRVLVKNKKYRFVTRSAEECLSVKCRYFVKRLSDWRKASLGVPCRDFLKSFFVSSGILRIASVSGNRESILLLYEYAGKYENSRNLGLSGFLDYINELSANDKQIADAIRSGDEDAVSFITVHKSKGLEFKVCFVAGTERKFQKNNKSGEISYLRGEGVYFKLRNRAELTNYDPLCNINAVDIERELAYGEELRKLYVALTRAKERLYITGSAEIGWEEKRYERDTAKSWLDLVLYTAVNREEKQFFSLRKIEETAASGGYRAVNSMKTIKPKKEWVEIASFDYPYMSAVSTTKKLSVSELREGLLEDDEYNKTVLSVPKSRVSLRPAFVDEQVRDFAEIGTANHLFMQFCDFNNIDSSGVANEADRLLEINMITKVQRDMLDITTLGKFFESELYQSIRNSKSVFREKRFSVSDIDRNSREKVLVQGVIDCFFENPDGSYTVVDYKTDRIKTADELVKRHKAQISYYKRAVEQMTDSKVSKMLLYSFALSCDIEVN